MKTIATILTTVLLAFSFTIILGDVFSEPLLMPQRVQQRSEKSVTPATFNENEVISYSTAQASKSMIRVYNGENQTVTVVLGCQANLTCMTAGFSTIIKPSSEIENKIDANLLNLTRLVTKNYIHNNQTNIIISLSKSTPIEEKADRTVQEDLFKTTSKLYSSKHAYSQMRFLAARLNYSTIFQLALSPQVDHIWLDRKFKACLDESVNIIKEPTEWVSIESSFGRSVDGSGVKIAILDTGVDSTHPDFYFPNGTSRIAGAISFTGESILDGFGHGTHCASIAAGTGTASEGQYVGVAPGATLLNVKVLDNQGEGLESWIISGIQWAVDNNADILSMSFGERIDYDEIDPFSTTVNWATEQGVTCVVAAGNSGPEMYTITTPGTAENAITVGASSKEDDVASFSSRGPTHDHGIKPDLIAPGVDIVAARADGTSMGTPVSRYYTEASGTSMATPHVAGAAALLLEAYPSWSPIKVKMALANYAEDIGSNVLEQGSGRLDVCKAANASVVGDSSISFGKVEVNTVNKHNVVFQNLADKPIGVTMNVEAWSIEDKTGYQTVSLSTSSFSVSPGDTETVELTLDTNVELPCGYFEGKMTATFDNTNIRIPLFFCILSQVNVEIKDESGSKLMAAFCLIDAQTGITEAYSGECESAQFIIVSPGDYVVQAMNVYGWRYGSGSLDTAISFIIHQKFSIGIDETKHLHLSLASAYKLNVRSTDTTGSPLRLEFKQLLTPYYYIGYFSEIGPLSSQYFYLTNISEYMTDPCYFGFAAFSQDDVHWSEPGVLTSEVDTYFIGWDLSKFGLSPLPTALNYADSELATFDVETSLPKSSEISTIWFNQIAGIWHYGLWWGLDTNPGITWKIHILPYQFKHPPSTSWAEMEWSCIYALSSYPHESTEYFVIDRHFQPILKGETFSYHMGKTPLLPQTVYDDAPYYGSGLYIPYYPLIVDENLFLAKTDTQATKRVQVLKDNISVYNSAIPWAEEPVSISHFLNSHGYGLYSFIVKTETNLNYSSQNVATYVINYTSSNTDIIPPSITRIDCTPCFTDNEYKVEIGLADNDEVCSVSLLYSLDDNSWTPQTLEDLGEGFYSADITLSSTVQKISLTIEATDKTGNSIRFCTEPAAMRGYETRIDVTLDGDTISGKLTVIEGELLQPLYLKVKCGAETMYALTDIYGNFGFTVPESMDFPIEIEMVSMNNYAGAKHVISKLQVHDVAITQLEPSKTIACSDVYIVVTIENQGDYTETFDVTVYADTTYIATQTITLESESSTALTLPWDPTGFAKGNYTISAYADQVPGETDTADNTYLDGWVIVSMIGDITGPDGWPDGECEMRDVGLVARLYGKEYPDPMYDPNCDIVYDLRIEMKDVGIVARHFGETDL